MLLAERSLRPRTARRHAALVVAGAVLAGCGVLGPAATPGPPAEVTGAMIADPIVAWVAGQTQLPVSAPVFVRGVWDEAGYATFREPGRPGAAALFETTPLGIIGPLDSASRDVIQMQLRAIGPVEFVATLEDAQDLFARGRLGCFPNRRNGTLVSIGAPLHPLVPAERQNQRLIVWAGVVDSCGGASWLLELAWDGNGYAVQPIDGSQFVV